MADSLTLTSLYPDIYKKMDQVSREMIGFLPAVSIDANMERAAKNQDIRTFVSNEATLSDFAAGQNAPQANDQTVGNKTIAITKERVHNILLDGNNQKRLNSSYGYREWLLDEIEQGLRKLTNEMEADLAGLHVKASRAIDPAGTNLFDAANYKDVANVRKILASNGAPMSDVSLVLSPSAAAAFRGNAQYYSSDKAGSDSFLRQGILLNIHGVNIRESEQAVETFTKGTGASVSTDGSAYSIGDTVITINSLGTGTILAGDIVKFEDDADNQYVVTSGDADVSDGGSITIAEPGLKVAMPASAKTVTVQDQSERNVALSRNAMHLVHRLLPIPEGGDSAVESMVIRDRLSGMNFDLRKYNEFGQVRWILGASWGYEMIKPEHSALLVD